MNARALATLRASSPRPADSENLRGPNFDPEDIVSRAGSSQFSLNPRLLDTISRQIEYSNLHMPRSPNPQRRINPLFISREESIFEELNRRYLVESESTTRDMPHIDIFSNSNNN